jgi:hypothetical protein
MRSIEAAPDAPSISCFRHELPHFVEDVLARRYQMLHSSLPFFKVFRMIDKASCYVSWHDGRPADILLFSWDRGRLVVLNEMIHLDAAALRRFAAYVFAHFPDVDLIRFNALSTADVRLGFPVQRYNAKDTFVVTLPATPDEYKASLGKSMRTSINYRMNAMRKHSPSFASLCLVGADIDPDDVRHLLRLSEQRIAAKGETLRHDAERIIALARTCGFVVLLMVGGRLCAGSINYRIGRSYFGEVIAHDPAYAKHGLGQLCAYFTICESIRHGGHHFYLGGGAFAFKEKLLGKKLDMDQLTIYRSRAKLLAHIDEAVLAAAHGAIRRLKQALHRNRQTVFATIVFKAFHSLRNRVAT